MPVTLPIINSVAYKAQQLNGSGNTVNNIAGSKSAATTFKIFEDDALINTTTSNTGTIPNVQLMLGARGLSDTTADEYLSGPIDIAIVATGLSDTEAANLYSKIIELRGALGRDT
jgi:hypothetical protein